VCDSRILCCNPISACIVLNHAQGVKHTRHTILVLIRSFISALSQALSDTSWVTLLYSAGNKFVRIYVLLMIYHGGRCITWQYMLCKPTSTTVFMPQLVPRRQRSRPQRCGRPINDASAQPCKKCKPLYRNTPPTHPEAC